MYFPFKKITHRNLNTCAMSDTGFSYQHWLSPYDVGFLNTVTEVRYSKLTLEVKDYPASEVRFVFI